MSVRDDRVCNMGIVFVLYYIVRYCAVLYCIILYCVMYDIVLLY